MKRTWSCKVGELDDARLNDLYPHGGADQPMREAVRQAYFKLTGVYPDFIFSGWGDKLTRIEREVVK
jgi:hypothetical protein